MYPYHAADYDSKKNHTVTSTRHTRTARHTRSVLDINPLHHWGRPKSLENASSRDTWTRTH